MNEEEALRQLEQECPRKIIGLLHLRGHYVHCTSGRFPSKVLCFHRDSEVPQDCQPTAAQQRLWQLGGADTQGATG